jgi:hypothetical protein
VAELVETEVQTLQEGGIFRAFAPQFSHFLREQNYFLFQRGILLGKMRVILHPFELDTHRLQLIGFIGDDRFQFRLPLDDRGAILLEQFERLRRRRDFIEANKTEWIVPRPARRTVTVIHRPGRGIFAGNGIPGEEAPQAAVLA